MPEKTIIITGVAGLVGTASAAYFTAIGFTVVGIDNNLRQKFFGKDADTNKTSEHTLSNLPNFSLLSDDIRDEKAMNDIFAQHADGLVAVIHCAAQPSHDWAAREPLTDFSINASGTLILLEATRRFAPQASFVFMSTNKVYGAKPNDLTYAEEELRWSPTNSEIETYGFDEDLGIDMTTHSIFGVSKASADLMVQEYGRYFGLNTVCLRGGCLTGPLHAGAELHGFLSYLVKCAVHKRPYVIFGYQGKQVRDNIHTDDLVRAIQCYLDDPEPAMVYNIGGGPDNTTSILEAIESIKSINPNYSLEYSVNSENRIGDHIWYVSDLRRFKLRYPHWAPEISIQQILEEMVATEEKVLGVAD